MASSGHLLLLIREASGIPECFPTLNETGKQPVPNAGTESGLGIGCSRMLGKDPVTGKLLSGMQTSTVRTPCTSLCNHVTLKFKYQF